MKSTRSSIVLMHLATPLCMLVMVTCIAHADSSNTFINVDSESDQIDDNVNDGICHTIADTCSLRAAVMQANHTPSSTIIRVPAGTYTLTIPKGRGDGEGSGDLNLLSPANSSHKISISGAGAESTVIDGNSTHRVFNIALGRSAEFSGIKIANGNAGAGYGGGIYSLGDLTLFQCVLEGNRAYWGGGGIYSAPFNALNIIRSTLRSNTAGAGNGGGIEANSIVMIRDSTLYDNGAENGGGLYSMESTMIVNSTISGNYANQNGGGIFSMLSSSPSGGKLYLYNSTVVNNDADHDSDPRGGTGGGIYNAYRVTLVNSLIAGNTRASTPIPDDCGGWGPTQYGRNLFTSSAGCAFGANSGTVGLDTIGPLQDNGGPTWTHALLTGSEAIDAGGVGSQGCVDQAGQVLGTDQSGAARIAGGRCDVGAHEAVP